MSSPVALVLALVAWLAGASPAARELALVWAVFAVTSVASGVALLSLIRWSRRWL